MKKGLILGVLIAGPYPVLLSMTAQEALRTPTKRKHIEEPLNKRAAYEALIEEVCAMAEIYRQALAGELQGLALLAEVRTCRNRLLSQEAPQDNSVDNIKLKKLFIQQEHNLMGLYEVLMKQLEVKLNNLDIIQRGTTTAAYNEFIQKREVAQSMFEALETDLGSDKRFDRSLRLAHRRLQQFLNY